MIVPSEKTNNHYLINPSKYKILHNHAIQKEYYKVTEEQVERINEEAVKISGEFKMDDRIEASALKSSYITLKDHKEDWPSRLHCRLTNHTKTNLGHISKSILDRLNGEVRKATALTQEYKRGHQMVQQPSR